MTLALYRKHKAKAREFKVTSQRIPYLPKLANSIVF